MRIRLSHSEIAKLIGSSRETVTLALKELREKGIIEIAERTIIIKAPKTLEELL